MGLALPCSPPSRFQGDEDVPTLRRWQGVPRASRGVAAGVRVGAGLHFYFFYRVFTTQ